jgi:succinate dehydrogenase / fumarate reductase, iron-sulfur subunit
MKVNIYRYNPSTDSKPYMKSYDVDLSQVQGKMLLDVLEFIKTQDPTLSFRRSCGEGVCGSDGMNINGTNGLACTTQINSLPKTVTLRPLPAMPVVRDLIVDLTNFYKQLHSVKPYLVSKKVDADKEHIQKKEDRDKLDGLYECILCACCTSACPSYWWNPDKFVGPAGLLAACRFILDSRDAMKEERLKDLEGLFRLYRCRSIMNCATVCPKSLNPTEAISNIRQEMMKGLE